MSKTRCPKCGGFGSSELKNLCRKCYEIHVGPIMRKNAQKNTNSVFGTFDKNFKSNGVFIPDRFGVIKDKFGLQER